MSLRGVITCIAHTALPTAWLPWHSWDDAPRELVQPVAVDTRKAGGNDGFPHPRFAHRPLHAAQRVAGAACRGGDRTRSADRRPAPSSGRAARDRALFAARAAR